MMVSGRSLEPDCNGIEHKGSVKMICAPGDEIEIDAPNKAREDFLALDKDETGRYWDSKYWCVTLDSMVDVTNHLLDRNWAVTFDREVIRKFDAHTDTDLPDRFQRILDDECPEDDRLSDIEDDLGIDLGPR